MFCPNCGQQIADNTKFCGNCGCSLTPNQSNGISQAQSDIAIDYSVMNSMQQYQIQKSAARQSEMRVLDNLIAYFSQKQAQYEEYDTACDAVNYYARGARKGLIVWGAIFSAIGLISLLAVFDSSSSGTAAAGLFAFLLPGLLMIGAGILMQIANKKNYQHALQRWQELSDELCQHYVAYPNCPVGAEYSNPQILVALRSTLQSGRADTIKECLNLMVADANQRAMESYLEQIQRNAAQSARANTASAIFLAASFFS